MLGLEEVRSGAKREMILTGGRPSAATNKTRATDERVQATERRRQWEREKTHGPLLQTGAETDE